MLHRSAEYIYETLYFSGPDRDPFHRRNGLNAAHVQGPGQGLLPSAMTEVITGKIVDQHQGTEREI